MDDLSWRSQVEWQKERFAAAAGIFAKQLTFHYNWQGDEGGDDIEEVFNGVSFTSIPLERIDPQNPYN